jgi:hypothetical protein
MLSMRTYYVYNIFEDFERHIKILKRLMNTSERFLQNVKKLH